MANENLTNQTIPTEVLAKALASIEKIEASLKPYLITLTKEERTNRSSMGDKSVAFVFKAHESAVNQPPTRASICRYDSVGSRYRIGRPAKKLVY